jgi:hypothetical protein
MIAARTGLACQVLTFLTLFAAAPAQAVIPTGSFAIELAGGRSIWLDAEEGENDFCDGFAEGFGATPLVCEFSLFVDAKGKITGSVEVAAENGNVGIELTGTVKGKLKSSKSSGTEVSFSTKLSGVAGNGQSTTNVSGDASFAGMINGAGVLTGEWSTKFCSKAAGCVEGADAAPAETLDGGDWTLFLEITDLGGGKLGGSAAAELADGTTCSYELSGKYNSKSDVASLKLSPTNAICDKTKISLKDVRVGATLEAQMKYKLFGQAGDTPVESVDR